MWYNILRKGEETIKKVNITNKTKDYEKQNGINFSITSELSYDLIFANKNHPIYYGGDEIGYTNITLRETMPLNTKKIFVMFQNYFFTNKKLLANMLSQKYDIFTIKDGNKLPKEQRTKSLHSQTPISLTTNEICEMLGKKPNKDNRKSVKKMIMEFANYMTHSLDGLRKTDTRQSYTGSPILTAVDTTTVTNKILFYFSDFYLLQVLFSHRPIISTLDTFNARSLRTFNLALFLVTAKYCDLKSIQNGINNTLTIKTIFEICDMDKEDYMYKDKNTIVANMKKLITTALKLIDSKSTWNYIYPFKKTFSDFYYNGKIEFHIPNFEPRLQELKLYLFENNISSISKKEELMIAAEQNRILNEEEKQKIENQIIKEMQTFGLSDW